MKHDVQLVFMVKTVKHRVNVRTMVLATRKLGSAPALVDGKVPIVPSLANTDGMALVAKKNARKKFTVRYKLTFFNSSIKTNSNNNY